MTGHAVEIAKWDALAQAEVSDRELMVAHATSPRSRCRTAR